MPLLYRIYGNDGMGGPIDYSTPLATTASTSHQTEALGYPGDYSFGIRVFDPATGLEEGNTDARVRVILDSSGRDVSAKPNKPFALGLRPTLGGGCFVSWVYHGGAEGAPPVGFQVYLSQGPVEPQAAPAATVPYVPSQFYYFHQLTGLEHRSEYVVTVRAYGLTPELVGDGISGSVLGRAAPPDDVENLSAIAI